MWRPMPVGPASRSISANRPKLAEAGRSWPKLVEAGRGGPWLGAALSLVRRWRGVLEGGLPDASGQLSPPQAAMAPRSRRQQELRGGAAGGGGAGGGLSWVPYLVVLVLVCIGPARPLFRLVMAF